MLTIYKELFNKFAKEEYHVDFFRKEHPNDYDSIVSSLHKLQDGNVLFIIGEDTDSITVELTPSYCYKFKEI